jgi:hypothetical protein
VRHYFSPKRVSQQSASTTACLNTRLELRPRSASTTYSCVRTKQGAQGVVHPLESRLAFNRRNCLRPQLCCTSDAQTPEPVMSMLLPFFHLVQGGLGAWGLGESYKAITNLQQYEDMSEKAAQYSRAASQQLHKTRTTQASGAIAVSVCLPTSPIHAAFSGVSDESGGMCGTRRGRAAKH